MPFSLHWLSKRSLLTVGLILVVTLTTLAFGLRTLKRTPAAVIPSTPLTIPIAEAQPKEKAEAELITLRLTGFEPRVINRTKGKFLLAVDNRSSIQEVTFTLNREKAEKLHEVKFQKGGISWRQMVNLSPGKYVLTEASHPEWICYLNIDNK